MVDSPSTILLLRLQATGGNTNLWGGYLNTALSTLERAAKGYQSYTVNGDATISWTNYSATNDLAVTNVKLVTGTVAAAFTLTVPAYEQDLNVWNATAYAATIKVSGGTGVVIPTLMRAKVFCDGTDVRAGGDNWLSSPQTTLTNPGDIVVKTTLETAIATASLPATAGTVLVSAADTTAGYVGTKVSVTGSGAATVTAFTTNPGANEVKVFAVSVGALGLSTGAVISATGTTAAVNTRYQVNKATSYTITLPAAPAAGDVVWFDMYGTAGLTTFGLNSLKYYGGTTNPVTSGEGSQVFTYTSAARGWIDL